MEVLDWSDALSRVTHQITTYPGFWPTVPFRLLVKQRKERKEKWVEAVVAHFQTSPAEGKQEFRLVEEEPIVLEGVMSEAQFLSALDNWSRGEPFELDGWAVWPPDMQKTKMYWHENLNENDLVNPLFAPLRVHASAYVVHWLSGSGQTPADDRLRDQVFRAAGTQQMTPQKWTVEYLGLPWASHIPIPQLHVYMPVPVALDASFDPQTALLNVQAFFRKPYTASDFWIRLGERWSAGIPSESFGEQENQADGWSTATIRKVVKLDHDTTAWVGTNDAPNRLRWRLPIPVTLLPAMATPPEQFRQWCLQFMNRVYDLAGPSTTTPQSVAQIAEDLGISLTQALQVMQYLVNEDLLKEYGSGGLVVLAQKGLREIVEAKNNPAAPTAYFPAYNITIGDVNQSQVMIASTNSQQQGEFVSTNETNEVATWVQQVTERLSTIGLQGEDLAEIRADLATIKAQLSSPRPRRRLLTQSIQGIVTLLETTAAAVTLAPPASDAVNFLLATVPHLVGK
jgi:DNA-binding IscR family transcriptional regulator